MKLIALLACLVLSCTSAQYQETKAQAAETGLTLFGGWLMFAVPPPIGPALGVGVAVIGIVVHKNMEPPDGTTVITKDDKGNIKKVEHFETTPREGSSEHVPGFFERAFDWLVAKFYLALGALLVWLLRGFIWRQLPDKLRVPIELWFIARRERKRRKQV